MELAHGSCRVRLRNLALKDVNLINSEIELSSDYLRYSDVLWLPHNNETIEAFVTNIVNTQQLSQYPNTLTIENEHGMPIGVISGHTFDTKHGIFSYGMSILNGHQGKGYGFEAANLFLYHMFYTRGYFKCVANSYQFNTLSKMMQYKIGFAEEGIIKNGYYCDGKFYDIIIWGLDKNNFKFMHNAQKSK